MAKVSIKGKRYTFSDRHWYHVVADEEVKLGTNCGWDAMDSARKHKGVSYYSDGSVHYDGRD